MKGKKGILFYNKEVDRYDIAVGDIGITGGLHCGECFSIKVENTWIDTRIEMGQNGWYLIGVNIPIKELEGSIVRYGNEEE